MDNLRHVKEEYFQKLQERSKKSRIYRLYQLTGLELAEILGDPAHKSLYMKLAKIYSNDELLRLAKNLAERKNIENKGAYFMKILKASDIKKLKS